MRSAEEYLLTFPVFIVLQAPNEPLGFLHNGGIHALVLFSDQTAAAEWLRPDDYLESISDVGKLLAHLCWATVHSHVVLDPKLRTHSAFAKISDLIS